MELELAICVWKDAHTSADPGEQFLPDDIPHAPFVVRTVGWVMKEDEVGVTLASESLDNGHYRARTFIPRGMVITLDHLPTRKTRKRKKISKSLPPPPPPPPDHLP